MSEPVFMRMFPLGSVLFPRALMPLHIFEDRYLQMIGETIEDNGEFAIVLIERGPAEGADNVRSNLGTVTSIVGHETLDDGRMLILTVGIRRIAIVEWLEDQPYPRALVRDLPELAPTEDLSAGIERAARLWRRIQALAVELGYDVEIGDLDLSDEPGRAVWELCGAAPLGPFDRQRLLAIDDPARRLRALEAGLLEAAADLEARLVTG
jgi:Lon protease-like protein